MTQVAIAPIPVDVNAVPAALLKRRAGPEPDAIPRAMGDAFETLGAFIGTHGIVCAGPPRAIYTASGPEGTEFTLAFPIVEPAQTILAAPGGPTVGRLDAARAWRFTHHGAYSGIRATYGQIEDWLKSQGLFKTQADWGKFMPMWEEYMNEPGKTPEPDLLTYVYLPRP